MLGCPSQSPMPPPCSIACFQPYLWKFSVGGADLWPCLLHSGSVCCPPLTNCPHCILETWAAASQRRGLGGVPDLGVPECVFRGPWEGRWHKAGTWGGSGAVGHTSHLLPCCGADGSVSHGSPFPSPVMPQCLRSVPGAGDGWLPPLSWAGIGLAPDQLEHPISLGLKDWIGVGV